MPPLILPARGFAEPRQLSRLLFAWEARDLSLTARSGQAGTFSRTSIGTALDSIGRIRQLVHSQPRWTWIDTDGDGIREPHLLLEAAGTNLCLQSENFGTTWTTGGTPTRIAAAHTKTGVTLDLLGDDDAAGLEYYQQTVTFAGNGVKAFSIVVKQGSSTSSVVAVADSTAGLQPLFFVITWSGGLPVVTIIAGRGTYLGYEVMADGGFRLLFSTLTVTAANTNIVQVFPATDSGLTNGGTGTIYVGGVQCENALFPSSYVKTTTGAADHLTEALTFPFNAPPRAMTVYVKFVERGTLSMVSTPGLIGIGNAATDASYFVCNDAAGHYTVFHRRGSDVQSSAAATPSIGQACELRALLYADGSVQLGQSIAGGAEVVASASAANALATAWNVATVTLNDHGASNRGFSAIQSVRIAAGVRTLAQMRAA